jgi:hypothetical protein
MSITKFYPAHDAYTAHAAHNTIEVKKSNYKNGLGPKADKYRNCAFLSCLLWKQEERTKGGYAVC